METRPPARADERRSPRHAGAAIAAALVVLLARAAPGADDDRVAPCVESCADLTVTASPPSPEEVYRVSVSFSQGPDDGASGGIDAIAALAFSLAIPGLELADCSSIDGDGLTPAVSVPPAVAEELRVVVANSSCDGGPAPCLCPQPGEPRAEHVNVVVFGPRDLPLPALHAFANAGVASLLAPRAAPRVVFPLLPDGELLGLELEPSSPLGRDVRLHVFAQSDAQDIYPKPAFAAFASLGDDQAGEQTVDAATNTSKLRLSDGVVRSRDSTLAGDCDGNGEIAIQELQQCVNAFLDELAASTCPACDADADGDLGIIDLQGAVNCLLLGSQGPECPGAVLDRALPADSTIGQPVHD